MALRLTAVVCFFSAACGRGGPAWPEAPTGGEADPFFTSLTETAWVLRTLTAARCNDRSLRWSFSPDGSARTTTTRDVLDPNGVCASPPVETLGRWSRRGREVEVGWPDGTRRFHAAVFAHAPRLSNFPSRRITNGGKALSTRAFERVGDAWLDEHEAPRSGQPVRTSTRVTISPPLTAAHDGAACTMQVTVSVDLDGQTTTETFSPPCVRLRDAATGWRAAGNLEKFIYRHEVVSEAGVFIRRAPAIASAIADGFMMALAVHDEQPDVAVHPELSDEALGWFESE
ncbi:MAG: hypothetical protein Q8N26_22815 [Myxococcales bacterium]|nr:hypothetical protein [Myxococcales bacterium]